MIIKKDPQDIWAEYQKGVEYNEQIDLYDTVQENEDFFIGRQWVGVRAPDLQKPVLNILKRCVTYFISTITSDDVGVQFHSFANDDDTEELMRIFSRDVDRIMEHDRTKDKLRTVIRNSAVDGDGALYWFWDSKAKSSGRAVGDIRSEIIPNINIIAGNPYGSSLDLQSQPWLIVAMRKPLDEVKDEARANGVREWNSIVADSDSNQGEEGDPSDLCTVIVKLWKDKDGEVHAIKSTQTQYVRTEWSTGCRLYPVAWMPWDTVRSSYHGQAAVSGLIPNQIAINKLFAMYIKSVETMAFPKIVYNTTMFPRGWSNRVGEAVGIVGDPNQAAVSVLRGGDVSSQVMDVIDRCINLTKDCMGANDAALGDVKVENAAASAIIATQQAAAAPLELQRQAFFSFVEQSVRIIVDFMANYYGIRAVAFEETGEKQIDPTTGMPIEGEGETKKKAINYACIHDIVDDLEVNVGDSAYWSELAQQQTLDNLLQQGIITDVVDYLEAIPDKWLKNKAKLIESAKKAQEAAQQQAGAMPQPTQQALPKDNTEQMLNTTGAQNEQRPKNIFNAANQ